MTMHQVYQAPRLNSEHLLKEFASLNPEHLISQPVSLDSHFVKQFANNNLFDRKIYLLPKQNYEIEKRILKVPPGGLGFSTIRKELSTHYNVSTIVPLDFRIRIEQVLSFSSIWMSQLMKWRNSTNIVPLVIKKAVTELSLPLLTVSSLIETFVYKVLHLGAKALALLSSKPLKWISAKHILERKDSSFFTITWTTKMLYHNIVKMKLPVHENEAQTYLLENKKSPK